MLLMALNVYWTAATTKKESKPTRIRHPRGPVWALGAEKALRIGDCLKKRLNSPKASLSPMSWRGRREATWSPDLMKSVKQAEAEAEAGETERQEVEDASGASLVGLSRLHLQQPEHCRVVPEFHPPLGGQAHVLSQVVHGSCTENSEKRGKKHTHKHETGGGPQQPTSHSLSSHLSD